MCHLLYPNRPSSSLLDVHHKESHTIVSLCESDILTVPFCVYFPFSFHKLPLVRAKSQPSVHMIIRSSKHIIRAASPHELTFLAMHTAESVRHTWKSVVRYKVTLTGFIQKSRSKGNIRIIRQYESIK